MFHQKDAHKNRPGAPQIPAAFFTNRAFWQNIRIATAGGEKFTQQKENCPVFSLFIEIRLKLLWKWGTISDADRRGGISMLNIVLVEPEIPQNTGNIARTCAATGARLHLVEPLGFDISDKAVKRAGLDYWHLVDLHVWHCLGDLFQAEHPEDVWLATSKGPKSYADPSVSFRDGCWLFFGKETAGLPEPFRYAHAQRCIRIPIRAEARCLNLSNSVAILAYEALRQIGFPGLLAQGEMYTHTPSKVGS